MGNKFGCSLVYSGCTQAYLLFKLIYFTPDMKVGDFPKKTYLLESRKDWMIYDICKGCAQRLKTQLIIVEMVTVAFTEGVSSFSALLQSELKQDYLKFLTYSTVNS